MNLRFVGHCSRVAGAAHFLHFRLRANFGSYSYTYTYSYSYFYFSGNPGVQDCTVVLSRYVLDRYVTCLTGKSSLDLPEEEKKRMRLEKGKL